ncbi:hypothetical protein ACJRO7_026333 [Eucalyptus globulus]|uniref:AAA+ ATPase domain-containing protein n=1 Tax=Eucalyptus globulus TaxID=34317 RepID=A0ABD3JTV3_EUCGL
MAVSSAVAVAWDVLKMAVIPIKHQFGYAISSKSYAQDLQEEVEKLEYEADRIHNAVEVATNNLRKVHNGVTKWQEIAEQALKEARNLLCDFHKASKTCCYGTLPNPNCRYQFSKKAKNMIKGIQRLAQKSSKFKDVSFSDPAPGNVAAPTSVGREGKDVQSTTAMASTSRALTLIKLKDDGIFESRALIIQDIMDALADNSNSVFGVYGMGGVGKSTLLGDAERRIKEETLFGLVTKADVSANPDIKRIQEEIAHELGLDIKNEEFVSVRAKLLCKRLEAEGKKKKVLIILDNLWERLDLKSVGIPCGHDNKVIGCKLLLTSRDRNVLQREMGCDKDFLLDGLQEEEARGLFERMAGDKVHDGKFKPLVDEALHKCAGFPFLIIAMAKYFKNSHLPGWRDALKQIDMSTNKGVSKVINEMLQLSYDHLKGEEGVEAKSLLRLCVACGVSKPNLENLVGYGVGLRLFQEDSSMEEVRDRLSSLIHTLQASSLLLDDEDANSFKIHDLVRGFVASVALRDHPFLVLKDENKLVAELSKDKLKSCKAICFPYVNLEELPKDLDCPELQMFLLFTSNRSLEVPDSYFNSMRYLMVLHLQGIRLTHSPSSFQLPENLHTLCLDFCSLDNLAILGELKGLQILSFKYSNVHQLPKEIGQLVELRLLNLSHCSQLEIIEPGVLRSLIKLEELYMENSFHQWNDGKQTPPTNAGLIELNNMKKLCTLHVSIPNPSLLLEDLNFKQLTKYDIQIGNARHWSKYKGSRTLDLKLDLISNILQKGCIQSILHKTDTLFLDGLNKTKQSVCALSQEGFPNLKHLEVQNSPSIQIILQWPSLIAFKTLESLHLRNLINLEKISNNNISSESFNALKVVRVDNCDKMEVLFPLSVVTKLRQLEEIEVVHCEFMRGIVEVDDGGKVELRNLRVLKLRHLPYIKNFLKVGSGPSSSTQVSTQIAFFNGKQVSIPSLESLIVEGLPNMQDIWSDESPLELSNLQSLVVVQCKSLSKVISLRSLLKLHKLHTLTIKDCVSVQEIFDLDGPSSSGIVVALFELTTLELSKLWSLRRIWNKNPCGIVSFHNLKKLVVEDCSNLGFIFFSSVIKSLAHLRDLTISNCEKMEAIIMEEKGVGMEIVETLEFSMLTDLCLKRLERLTCFSCGKCSRETWSQDHVQSRFTALFNREISIPSLKSLIVEGLPNMQEIWSDESPLELSDLQSLVVVQCKSLSKVISVRSLLKLHKLHTLTIKGCISMQEIFDLDGPSNSGIVAAPLELTTLELSKMQSLRHIWNKNPCGIVSFHNLKKLVVEDCDNLGFIFFPSMIKSLIHLRDLTISNCEKMEAIIMEAEGVGMEIVETLEFPMLTDLRLKRLDRLMCFSCGKCSRETWSQDHVQSRFTALFNREQILQVAFPSLETLDIEDIDNIKKIWDKQVAVESFHNLKSVRVNRCHKLVNLVSSYILGRLLSLESLKAKDCGSLEVIFELQPLDPLDRHPTSRFPLTELKLFELPKLKCVWDKELHYQDKFQCLRSISISRCESLTSLFPTSVAKNIIQLEDLEIDDCGVTELIEKEEGLVPRFVFPKLTSLKLKHLTKLKCIYTGIHPLRWPTLKTLEVHGCNKVEIFALQPENEMPLDKQPLFLIEKGTFPNLQELKLDLSTQMEIWHGHSHDEEFFCKLKVLELRYLSKESPMSIYRFVESLTNLEKLVICESYPKEPSSNEAAIEDTSHELKVTLPFLGYIRHLQTLYMSHCDGLSNLFTPTIIENLVALTKLRISNCKILTKVISDEEGEEGCAVAFNQLKYMELDGLTKLRCFSSSGYTLIFPLLEDVIVNECPNMKFFSKGPIEAPKLERVQVDFKKLYEPTKYRYFWEGNLNITLENMCKEMVTIIGIKFMRLFEFPELIRRWHNELNPIKSSWQIKTLMVDKCPSFINAIPSKLMLALEKIRSLQVGNCESLEEIFDLEGLDVVKSTPVLPLLWDINLINLPKLRQLWNKDLQGMMCFKFLYSLTLYKCNNLRHAFVPSMARCLANIREMEIRDCGQMEGVIVDEEGPGSAVEKITFSKLWSIRLKHLPNLTSFLSGKNHMLDCPTMICLTIDHCPKMRSLTWQALVGIDHGTPSLFTPQVQFPKLESMVISHMDNLSNIWTNSPQETLMFDCLQKVDAQNCKSLKILFPHWVATSLTELMKLQVESCGIKRIVSSGDGTPHFNTAQVLFPKLTSLVLHDMPQLQRFCPNLPTLNWPFLEELRVTHCDKLNMLSFAASMNSWAQRGDQQHLSDQEAHSSFERDFPMLERLSLVNKNIQMIQDGKFSEDFFGKPKALTLACFHDENAVFPTRFLLERFQNLQSLEVFCSSFECIFPNEGLVDEGKNLMLENLRKLKLNKLHNLKSVWREDPLVSKILQRIKTFEVWDCPCLTTIFPVVTSFQNLTYLVVKNSSGLIHLVTTSAVTNLVNLTGMTIIRCERMKEVVANDENGEGKVISFGKLKWLTLQHLLSLECFSPISSCIFRFPSLSDITVKECPKMKTFSKGMLSTPKLCWVSLFEYKLRYGDWKEGDDLNTTIQKLSA